MTANLVIFIATISSQENLALKFVHLVVLAHMAIIGMGLSAY